LPQEEALQLPLLGNNDGKSDVIRFRVALFVVFCVAFLAYLSGFVGRGWDLQGYAGKTTAIQQHYEATPAKKRLMTALKIFGV